MVPGFLVETDPLVWPAVSCSIALRCGLKGLRTGAELSSLLPQMSSRLLSHLVVMVGRGERVLQVGPPSSSLDTARNVWISVWSKGRVPIMQVRVNRNLENFLGVPKTPLKAESGGWVEV